MKKIVIIFFLLILFKIISNYTLVLTYTNNITLIYFKKIFPSMFLFFVISGLLLDLGLINVTNKIFGKILSYLFGISKQSSYVFILSILSGFPSSAKYIKELLNNKIICNKEAEKLLLFCHFANPLFIISLVPSKAFLIITCHFITNIIIGIIFRNYNGIFINEKNFVKNNNDNFMNILIRNINDAIKIVINLLGIIVFFYVISNLFNFVLVRYFLEMTSSITYLLNLNIKLKYKYALITGILSFGGLSIHMQVFSILEHEKIRYKPYLIARILHMIISIALFLILY